jgi:hypothetical protein
MLAGALVLLVYVVGSISPAAGMATLVAAALVVARHWNGNNPG